MNSSRCHSFLAARMRKGFVWQYFGGWLVNSPIGMSDGGLSECSALCIRKYRYDDLCGLFHKAGASGHSGSREP